MANNISNRDPLGLAAQTDVGPTGVSFARGLSDVVASSPALQGGADFAAQSQPTRQLEAEA
jgi:hypothetical protein